MASFDRLLMVFVVPDGLFCASVESRPVTTKIVRRWSEVVYGTLQGCLEVTDTGSLDSEPHGEDMDGFMECITTYHPSSLPSKDRPLLFKQQATQFPPQRSKYF